jgi:hypothetical protein
VSLILSGEIFAHDQVRELAWFNGSTPVVLKKRISDQWQPSDTHPYQR